MAKPDWLQKLFLNEHCLQNRLFSQFPFIPKVYCKLREREQVNNQYIIQGRGACKVGKFLATGCQIATVCFQGDFERAPSVAFSQHGIQR